MKISGTVRTSAGHLDHLLAQLGVIGHIDFDKRNALAFEQRLGANAKGAKGCCINLNFSHWMPPSTFLPGPPSRSNAKVTIAVIYFINTERGPRRISPMM